MTTLNSVVISTKKLKIYRNRNMAKLFSYADDVKDFKELFTPTLNGIAANVWLGFFKPVVQHSVSNDQLRRIQIKKTIGNEENRRN